MMMVALNFAPKSSLLGMTESCMFEMIIILMSKKRNTQQVTPMGTLTTSQQSPYILKANP